MNEGKPEWMAPELLRLDLFIANSDNIPERIDPRSRLQPCSLNNEILPNYFYWLIMNKDQLAVSYDTVLQIALSL